MKNFNLYIIVIIVLSIILGYTIGINKHFILNNIGIRSDNLSKFNRLIEYLKEDYFSKINTDSLVGKSIDEIITKLDPHSVYIPKEKFQIISERLEGNFVGIGISFMMIRDTLTVVSVLEGGPSKKAGILVGDRILVANNDTLFNKNYSSEEIALKLKGRSQTILNIEVYRRSSQRLHYKLLRAKVPIRSVISYQIKRDVGYIKVERFAKNTYDEIKKVLLKNKSDGISKLILDLRNNPGGYLFTAEKILDEFLDSKKIIVITESNNGKRDTVFASNDGIFLDQKIFVLVNRQSASASEVVAGAIQDNDRGIIVGRRTFGKGLVQQQFPLGGGDIIRLTTARYFTPTGRSIQRKYTSGNQLYFDEIDNRLNSEKIFRNEDFSIDDSIEFRTPKGKIVYGGGGIIPDVYVPRSENFNEQNFNENVINNFTFSFFDKYRDKLIVQNPKIFIKNPINDQEFVMKKFKDFCIENSIQMDLKKDKILNKIKAYLALYLYNKKAFFMILNKDDAVINKTLKMIEN